jgi:zona occludens toxin
VIRAFLGTPGSGKSYRAVCEILSYKHRQVFANFPLKKPRKNWHFIHNDDLTPWQLIHETHAPGTGWARGAETDVLCWVCGVPLKEVVRESRALLVIDECGAIFNADQSLNRTTERKDWLMFFAQHRKLGYDVIMVAQMDKQVDTQIRGCWEETVTFFKLNERYWFLLFWLPVAVFMSVSHWYHMRRFGGRLGLFVYMPWRGKRYDSMRLFAGRLVMPPGGPGGVRRAEPTAGLGPG